MKVAIIGAGFAGLLSLKNCKEEELDAACFEMSECVGGLWSSREPAAEVSNAYEHLITNTSKEIMAFSDHACPAKWPTYLTKNMVLTYIESYCERFDLMSGVKLQHKVHKLARSADHESTGCWDITVEDLTVTDSVQVLTFDAVMVCTGIHSHPHTPDLPNMDKFKGTISHSQHYTSHSDYRSQDRVMVLGNSSSGLDVVTDLCKREYKSMTRAGRAVGAVTAALQHEMAGDTVACDALAAQTGFLATAVKQTVDSNKPPVYLSARSGVFVLQRNFSSPVDLNLTLFTTLIGSLMPSLFNRLVFRMMRGGFDYHKHGLPTPVGEPRAAFGDEIFDCLEKGKVQCVPGIAEFKEDGVVLTNGESVELDAVIMATGYKVALPFLSTELVNPDRWAIYNNVWPVNLHKNTLALIGFVRVAGGPIPPLCELQARWAVQVFKGNRSLPSNEDMKSQTPVYTPECGYPIRKHINVGYLEYATKIARCVGCMPTIGMYFLHPLRTFFGPALPYLFRLVGPGRYPGAWKLLTSAKLRLRPSAEELRAQARRWRVLKENATVGVLVLAACALYIYHWVTAIYLTYELACDCWAGVRRFCSYILSKLF